MMKRFVFTTILLAAGSGAAVAAQDAKQVEAGKKLYETYTCQKCHRIGDVGSKISPLDHVATKLSAEDIRKWLVSPEEMTAKLKKKPMVKMKKQEFKAGEIDALVAYMLTLK